MLAINNQYVAVLDTCVVLPMPLCDTLLRLAEEPAFYIPKWSKGIMHELRRNMLVWGYTAEQAERRISSMNSAFENALVSDYEPLIEVMENNKKDRHVLAAAVKCKADAIVTDNLNDFPETCLAKYGIEPVSSEKFLLSQYHFDREQVVSLLEQQASCHQMSIEDLLGKLRRNVPDFVRLLIEELKISSRKVR
jgi:predicted nucleic acid-binding protein